MEIPALNIIVPDFYNGPKLQAAVNQAATSPQGTVWIPANYPGTDTYTNPSNASVFDMRSGGSTSFGSSSPSSLNTFFNKFFGLSPNDFGAFGDTKFCYDGVVTGQPTTSFKSLSTATITNTVLTSNVATYTISGAAPFATGSLVTITGTTNGGGVFNVTNQPILNYATGAVTFTVAITNANVGTAADTGTATSSCAAFTQADVGKTIEILAGGLASALDVSTTIASVQSSSQVTLTASATTNATGKKFWYAHDDTAALQSWVSAINAGIPTATGLQNHSGYLAGMYFTTKPLRFINPLGSFSNGICVGVTGGGYGTPEPWNLDNANESLSIWGQGAYRSGIVAGSQFNWASAGTGNNTGVFYFACWNGPTIQNFAVISPDYGIAFNTSTLTGKFGGFFDDANGHVTINGIEIANFHNTTSSLVGDQMFNGTFESVRNGIQVYNNDCAGVYGGNAAGINLRGMNWNNYVWGGTRGSGCNPGAAVVFGNGAGGLYNSLHITNFILDNESNSADMPAGNGLINFASTGGIGMDDNDEWQFENGRIQTSTQNNFAISVNSGVGKLKASFTNVNLVNTNATAAATTQLVLLQNANSDFNFFGGSWGVTGTAANGISVANGSTIHTHGTRQFGTIGIVGTGAAGVSLMTPNTTGWAGAGSWQASTYATTTNCAVNTVSPAACGAAASGAFVVPTTTTTYTVNTTAVTAASRITLTPMSFAGNLPSAPTCVAPAVTSAPTISAISAGVSFTFALPSTTGQTCWMYQIVN